jgi:hypothetical protein
MAALLQAERKGILIVALETNVDWMIVREVNEPQYGIFHEDVFGMSGLELSRRTRNRLFDRTSIQKQGDLVSC